MKTGPKNFNSLGSDLLSQKPGNTAKATTTATETGKGPLRSYHIDKENMKPLDRLLFWRKFEHDPETGEMPSQRTLVNEALRLLFESDPNSQRPMPNEK